MGRRERRRRRRRKRDMVEEGEAWKGGKCILMGLVR